MKKQSGFTLIELMIVVAIIAILAAIALPAYQSYTARAKFTEVTSAASALKTTVQLCYMDKSSLTGCTNSTASAANGTGWKLEKGSDYASQWVSGIVVTNGTIVATTTTAFNSTQPTYTLTPTVTNGAFKWAGVCSDTSLC